MKHESVTPNVRAVTRALAVLQSFSGKGLQSLAEVTHATGLDKGTARRLLLTLMSSGFVVQDPVTQRYGLGRAVRTLATSVVDNFDIRAIAVPIMSELAAELRITAFLSIYHDGAAICLERIHDMMGMEVRWWAVGGTLPLSCGGAPKLLLAFQPDAEIERALEGPLVPLTPKSITDKHELRKRLETIRKRGFELAVDDVALGLTALAVPIRDDDGSVICAISMAGLTPQMVARGRPIHLPRLMAAAATLERRLRRSAG